MDGRTDRRTDGGNDITPSDEVPRGKNSCGLFLVLNTRMDKVIKKMQEEDIWPFMPALDSHNNCSHN